MNVSLAAETLFSIGGFNVTNTMFTAIVVSILIIIFAIALGNNLKYDKPSKIQLIAESLVAMMYGMARDILGGVRARSLFAFLFTFAIAILVFNWFGLLPFVPSLAIKETKEAAVEQTVTPETSTEATSNAVVEEKPANILQCFTEKNCYLTTSGLQRFEKSVNVFRAPTSDLSFTVALAIISLVITNIIGFKTLKMGHLSRFINFTSPIKAFIGIMELVSEVSKIISFSFRLFGNIFAGEMLLVVITSLTYGIATLPFLALEFFVGVIQALVFFMLTTVFIGVAVEKPH